MEEVATLIGECESSGHGGERCFSVGLSVALVSWEGSVQEGEMQTTF